MCGIAGLWQRETSAERSNDFTSLALHHLARRGPDGSGLWRRDGIDLVHTRLSIIDGPGGVQPMEDEHGVIVFNGEIYNYQELRDPRTVYRTRSDTEVLLKGLNSAGPAFLDRLDGMFAFAYLDKRRHRLLLARDRFGIKPLYYVAKDDVFAFASTMHPLMMFSSKDINRTAFVQYYMLRGAVGSNTLFEDVHELPAGGYAVLDLPRLKLDTGLWAREETVEVRPRREAELLDELDSTIHLAVRRHLVADVPVATLLSGGVDSGLVTAIAAGYAPDLAAFSIGFRDGKFDESPYSQAIARRYGLRHHVEFWDGTHFLDLIRQWPSLIDDPVADPAAVMVHAVAHLARQCGYKAVLSGEGSDEFFCGYNQYWRFHLALRVNALGRMVPWVPDRVRAAMPHRTRLIHYLNTITRAPVFHGSSMIFEPYLAPDIFVDEIPAGRVARTLRDALALDQRQRLADDILGLTDRATMQASIELRVPFITRYMARFAAGLDDDMLIRGRTRKYLLKKLAERYLPHECIYRPKVGFDLPLAAWFRGPLREHVYDILRSTWQCDFFRPGAMEWVVETHMSGRADFSDKVWAFILLEENIKAMRRIVPTDFFQPAAEDLRIVKCA